MPFVLLFCGWQFFYFVFGLLLLDFINYVAFGEATLCYRILHAFGMENALGFVAFGEAILLNLLLLVKRIPYFDLLLLVKRMFLICCFW